MELPMLTPVRSGLPLTNSTLSQKASLQCLGFPELKRKMAQVTASFGRTVMQNMVAVKTNLKSQWC